jgi:hypothetical protein
MKNIIICPCGKKILVKPWLIKRKKYCSKECFYEYRPKTGFKKGHPTYEGVEKGWFKKGICNYPKKSKPYFDKSTGYWRISINGKEMKYHRYLMEQKLKRKLNEEEVVHHIDNNVNNNDLNNLLLFRSKSEHLKYHWSLKNK